ncbi:MAG TPA: hypothetical protein ENN64_01030 [bacterium]|nr:hypothetical protein [bacterium]
MQTEKVRNSKYKRDLPIYSEKRFVNITSFFSMITYTVTDFLYWWYFKAPIRTLRSLQRILLIVDDNFSISLLMKTFFIPWKRDYSTLGRVMGIIVRLLYLPIAIIIYFLVIILYLLYLVIWLALPIISIIFLLLTPAIDF